MISHVETIRRLRKERASWQRNLKTDHIAGVLYGLELAINIVTETRADNPLVKMTEGK